MADVGFTQIPAIANALAECTLSEDVLRATGRGLPRAMSAVCEEMRGRRIPSTPACVTVTFPYPPPTAYRRSDGLR